MLDTIRTFWLESGFYGLIADPKCLIMIALACLLLYLGIVKKFEPLLLVGIAFGMLLTNLPGSNVFHPELFDTGGGPINYAAVLANGGIFDVLYIGVKLNVYPCLIFLGVGAMTDFGPLLANPKSLLLGAAAQLGVYCAFLLAITLGFSATEAGSIGIIGGADGPTAIWLASQLAPHLLGPIAIAAYSYMALIPMIQPPIMRLVVPERERKIQMKQERNVTQTEKIVFPIAVSIFAILLLPSVAPLIGCLMLGNLFRECGVVDRLSDTAQNNLMNIVVIFLSLCVGATAKAEQFLSAQTILIIVLGLLAFGFSTFGGLIFGRIMCWATGGKINPLIGSAGVSAVPMAARVSQIEGRRANPDNHLLMHAMGPNVAGVIGSAVAAGFLLNLLG
jgi:oxaloacetate decarboxylase beta subunit